MLFRSCMIPIIEGLPQPTLPYFTVPIGRNKDTKRTLRGAAYTEVRRVVEPLAWLCGGNGNRREFIEIRYVLSTIHIDTKLTSYSFRSNMHRGPRDFRDHITVSVWRGKRLLASLHVYGAWDPSKNRFVSFLFIHFAIYTNLVLKGSRS